MKKALYLLIICSIFACSKKDQYHPPKAVNEIMTFLYSIDSLSEFAIALNKTRISNADAAIGLTVFALGNQTIKNANTSGKDLPDSVVKNYIVRGVHKRDDLTDGKQLTTLSGKVLTVKIVDGKVSINGIFFSFDSDLSSQQAVYILAKMFTSKPGNIDITVYDATKWNETHPRGELLAGAKVSLYDNWLSFYNDQPVYAAISDANGVAHFNNITPFTYFTVVTKGELSSSWYDHVTLHTYVSNDTLFQSQTEISNAPRQDGAAPGDFRFTDVDQNGIINSNDEKNMPVRTIIVSAGETTTDKILIGYEVNHLKKLLSNSAEAQAYLNSTIEGMGSSHSIIVMTDSYLSDDAACTGQCEWRSYDNFEFNSSDTRIKDIWDSEYTSIEQLNRIILSCPSMTGDTANLAAQARGLRAFIYMEMAAYFGGLPVYPNVIMPKDISRSSLADTYKFIQNELNIALAALPVTASPPLLTTGAAKSLLARIALYNNDFTGAKSYANAVIQSGNYSLVDSTQKFADPANAEAVWSLSLPSYYTAFFGHPFAPVIRLSEIYLISAEADIALGNVSTAAQNIGLIRNRSGMPAMGITTAEEAKAALVDTYQREFYREGYRYRSLVRWGLATQVLSSFGFQTHNNLLPIPYSIELTHQATIVQNPGY